MPAIADFEVEIRPGRTKRPDPMQIKPLIRSLPSIAAAAALAGCAAPFTNSNTVLIPIAGGKTTEMSFNSRGPVLRSGGGVQLVTAGLFPAADRKHVDYVFEFSLKGGAAPKRVTIEDMTEDPTQVLVDDTAPRLNNGYWKATTPTLDPKDRGTIWLTQVDDSVRVFRFTVVLGDGTSVVLDQAAVYPGPLKAAIAKMAGLTP